jgi:complex III assembly factor LYRM7
MLACRSEHGTCDVSGTLGTLRNTDNRDQSAAVLSRVGNFLAVGLPHRIVKLSNAALKTSDRSNSYNMALVAYRNLLRSARIAFQGTHPTPLVRDLKTHNLAGDMNVLFAARAEARKNFESNRNLAAGSDELSKQITHAEEVAKFLRENVVQGQAADNEGNYSMLLGTRLSVTATNLFYRATDTRAYRAR